MAINTRKRRGGGNCCGAPGCTNPYCNLKSNNYKNKLNKKSNLLSKNSKRMSFEPMQVRRNSTNNNNNRKSFEPMTVRRTRKSRK